MGRWKSDEWRSAKRAGARLDAVDEKLPTVAVNGMHSCNESDPSLSVLDTHILHASALTSQMPRCCKWCVGFRSTQKNCNRTVYVGTNENKLHSCY